MPTDQNDPHRRIDGLQHEFNMLQTTTKAELQTAKAEGETAYERLLSAQERMRTMVAGIKQEMTKVIVISVGVGVAFLSVVITLLSLFFNLALDRNSQPAPTIIYQQAPSAYYQPPANSVLPNPN